MSEDELLDEEILAEFLSEAGEKLDELDPAFVELEQDPSNLDVVNRIFRAVHTVKGNSGFLGLHKLERVAHAGENVLVLLRDGALQVDTHITDLLLQVVDAFRLIMRSIGNECRSDARRSAA